jgi:hypothetical protein
MPMENRESAIAERIKADIVHMNNRGNSPHHHHMDGQLAHNKEIIQTPKVTHRAVLRVDSARDDKEILSNPLSIRPLPRYAADAIFSHQLRLKNFCVKIQQIFDKDYFSSTASCSVLHIENSR